ncbi:hypothetical protein B484DRAFT_424324 [Ochromonadaceae sp. CCMP2298]|nr:hypothetical protein B484DRAFT_424324 [Ochromonadaceae sp. CCMP2298]
MILATPTAVVLMAINSLVAYTYTAAKLGVDAEVYRMWLVSIPIVAVGAPLGAIVSSHFHRYVLSALVYIVDAVQMTAALAIIQPWSTRRTDSPLDLCVDCGVILVSGSMFFAVLAKAGQQLQEYVQVGAEEEEGTPSSANSSPNTKIGMTDNPTLARKNADDAEETESDSGTPHNEADVDEHQLQPAPHLVHALFRSIGDQVQEQTIQWRKKVVFVTVLTHLTEQEAVAAINSYSNTYSAKVALPWEEMRKLPRKGGKHRGDPRNLPYRGDKQNPKNLYDYERLKKKAVGKALRLERHTQKKKSQKARKKRKAAKKI